MAFAGLALSLAACASDADKGTDVPDRDKSTGKVFSAPSAGGLVPTEKDGDTVTIELEGGEELSLDVSEKPKIAAFLPGFGNAFAEAHEQGARDAAEEYGYELEVFDPQGDPATQRNQLQTAISSGDYKLMFLSTVDDSTCSLAQSAHEQGILLNGASGTLCGRYDKRDEELVPPGIFNFTGGSQTRDGIYDYAEQVVADSPDGTALLVVGPETAPTAINMIEAFKSAAEGTNFKIEEIAYTNFTRSDATEQVQTLLQSRPDVDVIATQYGELTEGVAQVLKRTDKGGDIKLYGTGASAATAALIKDGVVTMDVGSYAYSLSYAAVESLILAAQGESVPRVILNDGEPLPEGSDGNLLYIREDNVKDFVPQI